MKNREVQKLLATAGIVTVIAGGCPFGEVQAASGGQAVYEDEQADISENTVEQSDISGNTVEELDVSGNTAEQSDISGNTIEESDVSGDDYSESGKRVAEALDGVSAGILPLSAYGPAPDLDIRWWQFWRWL